MNNFKKIIFLYIVFIQGCAGVFLASPSKKVLYNPSFVIENHVDVINNKNIDKILVEAKNNIFKDEVFSTLGKPEKIIKKDNKEKWVYYLSSKSYKHNSWLWFGFIPTFLIVPIPFTIPIGKEYIEFTIENDRVIKALLIRNNIDGFYCGLLMPIVGHGVILAPDCIKPKK